MHQLRGASGWLSCPTRDQLQMFWRELTLLQGNFPLSTNSPLLWDLILSTDHTAGKEFEQQTLLGLQNFISPEGK